MNKPFLVAALAMSVLCTRAEERRSIPLTASNDTVKVIDIDEVTVIATPKENSRFRNLPLSSTVLNHTRLQQQGVTNIKGLTANVPSLFIPDYGSRLTSAIYMRGIGSRMNTPGVGLYVDNVPFIDKSAFDFDYTDVERIDVLRGPQSTLYGRNTMGGLIRVFTKNPFKYQGTDFLMTAATRGEAGVSLTHYHRNSERFAFSAGGHYTYNDGFFTNHGLNRKADRGQDAGGRLRAIWLPTDNLKIDANLRYEYSDEGGYTYGESDGKHVAPISTNHENTYHRSLINGGLTVEWNAPQFVLTAVTGVQHLGDRMFIDQDFSVADIYTIAQGQRMTNLSEEITLKSRGTNRRWDWVTGAFGFHQALRTDAPVTFRQGGIQMIQKIMNDAMTAAGSPVKITLTDQEMPIAGDYHTPITGLALYHQSTFNDLFGAHGLSATLGLRLEHERMNIDHETHAVLNAEMKFPGPSAAKPTKKNYDISGKTKDNYTELLPKLALTYAWEQGNNVYASVTKGYRSGGYNIQMFSDVLRNMMMGNQTTADTDEVNAAITYKPETTWSYEVGSHLTLLDRRLTVDAALYWMETKDQQVTRFAQSGLGRQMVNAGESRSLGAELALRAQLTDALSVNVGYGYTRAKFTDYNTFADGSAGAASSKQGADYKGKTVPFVPKHTFNAGAAYRFPVRGLDDLTLSANYQAAGRIYWTEANTTSQAFTGTLNGRLSATRGILGLDFWVRNALNTDYTTFYFESMGKGFAQRNRPVQLGVDVRLKF